MNTFFRERGRGSVVLIGTALATMLLAATPAMAAVQLPDLGMARLGDLKVQKTSDGRRLLRYTSIIVNTGAGPLEARGQRSSTGEAEMSVTQPVYDDAGGARALTTPARMFFAPHALARA